MGDRLRKSAPAVRITERDRLLLELAADHRFVQPAHAQALLGASPGAARARLRALSAAGMLNQRRWLHGHPACYQITSAGLALIGSDLPRPRIDLRCYEHDIGVAWVWLAARSGSFGPLREVLSERQLRSRDASAGASGRASDGASGWPLAVRLGGSGPGGRERLHYPDLVLTTQEARRIAIELELSSKGRTRRERILAGYGADARFDGVLYLVDGTAVGRAIAASARRLGISDRVHVQRVRIGWPRLDASPGIAAGRARGPGRDALGSGPQARRSGPRRGSAAAR